MKKLILLFFILTACSSMTMEAGRQPSHLTPHFEGSLFKITDKRYYSVEILLKSGTFSVGSNRLELIIHKDVEGNRDVEGAQLKVTPRMPKTGHGVPAEPVITERGAGVYWADNVVADIEGDWELRIEVRGEVGTDTVVFSMNDIRMPQ